MTDSAGESLARLQGLQRDLSNLSATTLQNIDRLWLELQSQLDDFRNLLDKSPRSDGSRKTLNEAKDIVKLEGDEYRVTDDFKQQAVELADALDLDELKAAKLLIDAQDEAPSLDRTPLATSIILFHQRRQFLLECLRLSLEKAYMSDTDLPEEVQGQFQALVPSILGSGQGEATKGSAYWQKCITSMNTLESTISQVAERVQSVSITNQQQSAEFVEIMSFQSSSMLKQHESLGAIVYWLARGNWTAPDDLRFLVAKAKTIDRYDAMLVHYLPGLLRLISSYASSDAHCSPQEASALHQLLCSKKDADAWNMRTFQAAAISCWLADYSARFVDGAEAGADADVESRGNLFMEALKDGAFHFLLSVGNDMRQSEWYDPARKGMTTFLVHDAPALQTEPFQIDDSVASLVLERLQSFTDAYISNMPDSLRKLKFDEDEQRRQIQNLNQSRPSEFDLHFERFLLIIAYSFEGSPVAAEAFWDDADSNLHGFLQWASQRQSTPRAAAFCEMLSSLSQDEECANHAHQFLLDESAMASAKLRRSSPLSWNHILRELEFFASTFKNKPALPQSHPSNRASYGEQIEEPESELMLECYLRLVAHLARQSTDARTWLLANSSFNLVDFLILLCGSSITSRTRACAFAAMTCLLTSKDDATHKHLWNSIDMWMCGQSQNTIVLQGRVPQSLTPRDMEKIFFQHASAGFEEPNAVVGLFTALISPSSQELDLNDALPFPEDLGAKYRMAGIDSYVDFVMNDVFARKSVELQDPVQLRIVRLNCLTFAAACLSTFNESLLLFANQTNLPVDSAIAVSSLSTYAKLHPFARVMEWAFNDSVIMGLFMTAIQDIDEVNAASEDSPLVLSLLKSLEVLELVLGMQSTYFDLIRPIVKTQSSSRRMVVANSALASFEDAILNHMDLVRALGIYSGSGHTILAAGSLRLLQRLSRSRKLATPVAGGSNRRSEKSRLIAALAKEGESDNISRSLASIMQFDGREAEYGPESPGIAIKTNIMHFLAASLETLADRPTVAHLLLGFTCDSHSIYIVDAGLFSAGTSLFHALVSFVVASPDGGPETFISWLLQIKDHAWKILQILWRSRLSSSITLDELRRSDFLLNMAAQQSLIRPDSLWNGSPLADPTFYVQESAVGLAAFLQSRSAFLECAATELRFAKKANMTTLQGRIQASLFGSTTLIDGEQYNNPSIFDFLDFLDIDPGSDIQLPISTYFQESVFDICREKKDEDSFTYDISSMHQIVQLRQSELRKQAVSDPPNDESQLQADIGNILQVATAHNQRFDVMSARMKVLRAWIQLAMVMLECCDLTPTQRTAFVLQLLQKTLPWLERSYSEDMITAGILAKFGLSLLRHIDFDAFSREANLSTDTANDRLFQLFRAAALGAQYPESPSSLRETCDQLCRSYIHNVCKYQKKLVRRALACVKSIGDNFIETVCDDASTGDGELRISALLLLESIVVAANQSDASFVFEGFSRINFVQVVTNSLRDIPSDLSSAGPELLSVVVSYHQMNLGLLLRIAQSRGGAGLVFNAGFFNATRDSGIFLVDPDIGLDIDNAQAMSKYLQLMLSFTRVVNAIVVSRGSESDQTIHQAVTFLNEYRPSIVSILKRSAGIGSSKRDDQAVLRELVDNFTVLISATGFLESEQDTAIAPETPRLFS